jgi:hypothetical protein
MPTPIWCALHANTGASLTTYSRRDAAKFLADQAGVTIPDLHWDDKVTNAAGEVTEYEISTTRWPSGRIEVLGTIRDVSTSPVRP